MTVYAVTSESVSCQWFDKASLKKSDFVGDTLIPASALLRLNLFDVTGDMRIDQGASEA
jgi:hypothetical protein